MNDQNQPTFKQIILARYCGEFIQATEETATIEKTSEQILLDLRPAAEFTTNEIAEFLTEMGYEISFSDATPVWLMRKNQSNEIENP